MSISFRIDELPKTRNELDGWHWTKKHKHAKHWKEMIYWAVLFADSRFNLNYPYDFAVVTLTRHSSGKLDQPGLSGSFKAVVDALTVKNGIGILVDDDPRHITEVYFWVKAPPKKGYIEVKISPCERPLEVA